MGVAGDPAEAADPQPHRAGPLNGDRLLRIVADVSAVLARSGPDSEAILEVATRSLADAVGDACIVALADDEQVLRPSAFHHRDPDAERVMAEVLADQEVRLGDGVPGLAARTGTSQIFTDLSVDKIRSQIPPAFRPLLDALRVSSVVVVPLVSSGQVIGTLAMSRGPRYTPDEQALIEDLAGRIALAVDRARAHEREQAALQRLEQSHRQLMAVTDNVKAMVGYWDRDLRNRFSNRMYTDYFGKTPEEIHGRHISEVLGPDLAARNLPYMRRALAGEEVTFDVPLVDVQGRARRMQVTYTPDTVAGAVLGFYVLASDVTEKVVAREALQASEDRLRRLTDRYRMLAENASDVVFRIDDTLAIRWISPSVREVLDRAPEEIVGRPVTEFWHPEDRDRILQELRGRPEEPASYEARFRVADGGWRWFAVTSRPARDQSGAVIGRIGSMRDIQAQVADRQALARSEQLLRLAVQHAPSGMAVVDLDRRFVIVNPTLCRMTGRDPNWLRAHRVPDLLDPDDDRVDLQNRARLLAGEAESVVREAHLLTADGAMLWVEHQIALLRHTDGTPLSFISQFVDVTEARRHREELQFFATHDQLTGLPNRTELVSVMERILTHEPRRGDLAAVLFLDVDRLKPVNDTLGHAVGDELLVQVARRLTESVREHDLVARLGGDEFVVFLTGLRTLADATAIAQKILAAVAAPMQLDSRLVHTSVSIGIAAAAADQQPQDCLTRADAALYKAKAQGGNTWALEDASGL